MSELSFVSPAPSRIRLQFASDESDMQAVQKLRWRVFYEEMGAIPDACSTIGLDSDPFDCVCDHLLVIDDSRRGEDRVVGTYRLLRESSAMRHGGFYSAGEYDLRPLVGHSRRNGGELLELGRSCVLPEYRNSATIALLWRGVAAYIEQHGIGLMFGCASFPGTEVAQHAAALSYLHHHHLAPVEMRPIAHADNHVPMELLHPGSYDPRAALHALPPLIKAYLRVGALVGAGAFVDRQFNTVDVSVVMPVTMISRRYATRFSVAA